MQERLVCVEKTMHKVHVSVTSLKLGPFIDASCIHLAKYIYDGSAASG